MQRATGRVAPFVADLACRGLDEVCAGGHREHARLTNAVVGAELAGLEDHLQVRRRRPRAPRAARRRPARTDRRGTATSSSTMSISCAPVSATSRISCRRASSGPRPLGDPTGDARDLHPGPHEMLQRDGDELRIEAHSRDGRDRRVERVGSDGLGADRHDLADRVAPLQRREVHRADREVERPELGVPLDRSLRGRRPAPRGRRHRPRSSDRHPRPPRRPRRAAAGSARSAQLGPCVDGSPPLRRGPAGRLPRHADRTRARDRDRRTPRAVVAAVEGAGCARTRSTPGGSNSRTSRSAPIACRHRRVDVPPGEHRSGAAHVHDRGDGRGLQRPAGPPPTRACRAWIRAATP